MRIGVFSRTFGGEGSNPGDRAYSVLSSCHAAGFGCAQFNFSSAGLPALPDSVDATALAAIGAASSRAGVPLLALSATANLIHPDFAQRARAIERVAVALHAARVIGVPIVTLCSGTRDPDDPWRGHPDNATPEAWRDLRIAIDALLPIARGHGVALGVEPEGGNVVIDAAAARRLLDEVGDPALRIVFDPANLPGQATSVESARIVAEGIALLAPAIALVHAKDRDADGSATAPGHGIIDFPALAARLRAIGYGGPVIAHGFGPEVAAETAVFLNRVLGG